jgi:hypothetical protein
MNAICSLMGTAKHTITITIRLKFKKLLRKKLGQVESLKLFKNFQKMAIMALNFTN